jgi:hypothetical protein
MRLLGESAAVDISDKAVLKYQTDRLGEGAAPKTINEEVGFLLRLLEVTQAGAIRAQLKQRRSLSSKFTRGSGKPTRQKRKPSS